MPANVIDLQFARDWRTAVEDVVRDTAAVLGVDEDTVIDSVSFVESLDPTIDLDLDSAEFVEAVEAAVADWAEADDPKEPYGPASEVEYADPGYQPDGKKRYPLSSESKCRAAWSYINMPRNAAMYTADQLERVKGRIKAALKRYGVEVAEDAEEAFDPAAHPRADAGSPAGGEFAPVGGGDKAQRRRRRSAAQPMSRSGVMGYDPKSNRGTGYGIKGGDARVRRLQQALNRLGLTDADGADLVVDGQLGPKTTTAVKAAQKRLGVEPDGQVTPDLLDKLAKAKTLSAKEADGADATRVTESTDRIEGRLLEALGTDENGGRVYRVRILDYGDSRNGRRYSESVMRGAVALYEGAKAYDHHRTPDELKTSTIAGLIGSYRNVEAANGGLDGDLHLLRSAVHTAECLDASLEAQAQGRPALVGISHDVQATFRPLVAGGRRMQEATAITKVHSADVVADPAAGGKAVRTVAGGIDPDDDTDPAGQDPATETTDEESDVTVTTEAVLDAFKTASDEQLAAVGLARVSTSTTESIAKPTTTTTTAPPPAQRTTEADTTMIPKVSYLGRMMIRDKVAEAGLSAKVAETLAGRLPDRVTESDVDSAIAGLKDALAIVERPILEPTVGAQVVREAVDKKKAALDAFFAGRFSEGYVSFRQAFVDFTGQQPRRWDEDFNRVILRESFGHYDSAVRSTESLDSTSWAQVLGDSVTRRLVEMYRVPSLQSWRQIVSSVMPVNDFRTQRVGRTGGYGTLPPVAEGGTYQPLTSPPDEEATYANTKRGGTEDLTLEMIANDDVRAISNIPTRLGRAAAQTLYRFVWDFLRTNPTCTYDSVALFHASHANTTAAALSQSNLSTLRALMREQTAFGDSSEVLGFTPKILVVPPELEELAFQLVTSAVAVPSTPAGPSDTPNLHQNMQHIVVDYFSDANDWYLVGDKDMCPTIEIGFYLGREEPELFQQSDAVNGSVFTADVFTWKIRHIYGGTILDHRGMQRGTQ